MNMKWMASEDFLFSRYLLLFMAMYKKELMKYYFNEDIKQHMERMILFLFIMEIFGLATGELKQFVFHCMCNKVNLM